MLNLGTDAFDEAATFDARLQGDAKADSFKPPGHLVESYTTNGRQYEIWLGELTDPVVKTIIDRMQICVSFFIDGGLPLLLDDQEWTLARWRVFFM